MTHEELVRQVKRLRHMEGVREELCKLSGYELELQREIRKYRWNPVLAIWLRRKLKAVREQYKRVDQVTMYELMALDIYKQVPDDIVVNQWKLIRFADDIVMGHADTLEDAIRLAGERREKDAGWWDRCR